MGKSLHVLKGVEGRKITNDNAIGNFKKIKRKKFKADDFVQGIIKGDITTLSKAITLVESSKEDHQEIAREIIEKSLPHSGKSIRIGITGVPGVGKSTFIESLGNYIIEKGHKLAVLAIDPSSERTKGSILGDKTRMEKLSSNNNAYIRPSPSSGTLGGVARKTRESIILCEAAGFDVIFIETVGVGQSETAVFSMVDFFLLLMLSGAGDELQGIKRGIMEMADAIAITKADGNNLEKAKMAQAGYKNAIHYFPPAFSGWVTEVVTCSSLYNNGIEDIWELVRNYHEQVVQNGYFNKKRREQTKYWLYETIHHNLKKNFYQHRGVNEILAGLEKKVLNEEISPFNAASLLFEKFNTTD